MLVIDPEVFGGAVHLAWIWLIVGFSLAPLSSLSPPLGPLIRVFPQLGVMGQAKLSGAGSESGMQLMRSRGLS